MRSKVSSPLRRLGLLLLVIGVCSGSAVGQSVGVGAVSMMLPPKVRRSTMAAQRRGSVKVLVQPPNDSLDAIATEAFSSRSVRGLFRTSCRTVWNRPEIV